MGEISEAEFIVDVCLVIVERTFSNHEIGKNLFVRDALSNKAEKVSLARTKSPQPHQEIIRFMVHALLLEFTLPAPITGSRGSSKPLVFIHLAQNRT